MAGIHSCRKNAESKSLVFTPSLLYSTYPELSALANGQQKWKNANVAIYKISTLHSPIFAQSIVFMVQWIKRDLLPTSFREESKFLGKNVTWNYFFLTCETLWLFKSACWCLSTFLVKVERIVLCPLTRNKLLKAYLSCKVNHKIFVKLNTLFYLSLEKNVKIF